MPIRGRLRDLLLAHRAATGGVGPIFARRSWSTRAPARARNVWEAAGLPIVTLHEGRHSFASFAIDAGANAKALSTIMGHASIKVTYDNYGHLLEGAEAAFGDLFDTYLARKTGGQQGRPHVARSLSREPIASDVLHLGFWLSKGKCDLFAPVVSRSCADDAVAERARKAPSRSATSASDLGIRWP